MIAISPRIKHKLNQILIFLIIIAFIDREFENDKKE